MTTWKNKRVFISGGSGVIGTALVNNLLEQGASLFIGDLKPQPTQWASIVKYREGDLITLNQSEIQSFSPEIYFHLAASFERTTEKEDFWHESFHHNVLLSHHLLSIQKDLPSLKKIIFASSYLVYDSKNYLFNEPQKSCTSLKETESIFPRNLCGMAKLLHEQEIFFVKKFRPDLQVINARIFRSYGKNSRDIISRWIRSLLNEEPIHVYCPEGRFDFVFAEDVAKALQILSESLFNGVVNIGTGQPRSIDEVLEILGQHFKTFTYQPEISDIPYEWSKADISLFHCLSNKFTFQSLEQVIPKLIDFEKKHFMPKSY